MGSMDHEHGPSCFCIKPGEDRPPPAAGVRLDEAIGRGIAVWRMIGDRMAPLVAAGPDPAGDHPEDDDA